jgi:hypothetical protein
MTTPWEWGILSDLLSGSTSDYLKFFFSKSVNDIKRYPHQILLLMHKVGSRGQAGNVPEALYFALLSVSQIAKILSSVSRHTAK